MSKKRNHSKGLPPGTIIFKGNKRVDQTQIHYLQYDTETLTDKNFNTKETIAFLPSPEDKVDWYDVRGLHDTDLVENVGKAFNVHKLILEDIPDTYQRPKFEEYDNGAFIVVKAIDFDESKLQMNTEHVSIYFYKGLVLSFQESSTDLFEAVRARIQSGKGRIRSSGADYLVYAIIDVVVDNYFLVLDEIEEKIEALESKILFNQDANDKQAIHNLKRELLLMRKSIAPLREAISRFSKCENEIIQDSTSLYLRDLHDHTIQIMDSIDSFRDLLNSLQDLYISEISFKMNQVMQILTLVSTIFIPLTFIAGIYGMNFTNMPELHSEYGYYIVWGIMLVITAGLIIYFKRKNWF